MFAVLQTFPYLYGMEKNQKTDIDDMIMGAHYLHALDKESLTSQPLSEMEREDYIGKINNPTSVIEQFKESYSLLKAAMESSEKRNEALQSQVVRLQETICTLTDEIRSLREEISKQSDYTKRHNKMSYGKKSLSSRSKQEEKNSREEERMDDDGSGTPPSAGKDSSLDLTKANSENIDKERGSRGPYTAMEAAKVIHLKTILEDVPTGMRFIGYKTIDEFNRISYIECTRFEVAVYEDEYGIRHDFYHSEDPKDGRRPKTNVISGTPCTPEFLADMVVNRWMIHTPNHRENIRMRMDKFTSSENSRSNWLKIGAKLLKPLCEHFKKNLLKVKSIPNIDETWCRVRIKYKGDGTKLGKYFKKYVWVLVNKLDGLVYFLYDNDENDSRGCRPIEEFLGDFKGSIQSDGYVVYKHLSRTNPENVHLLCWAHVRAKFKYAEEINKDPDAAWFVEQIGLLYMVEAENIKFHRTVNEIKLRRSRADVTGILSALHARAEKMIKNGNHLHYGDLMNKALNYMLNGWDELQNYRMDGQHTIDNMIAERVIRPFTVNRKNSLFYSSEQGVDVAATYLTIIETAKIHGLEVWDYLVYVFREIMNENKDCLTYAPEAFLA